MWNPGKLSEIFWKYEEETDSHLSVKSVCFGADDSCLWVDEEQVGLREEGVPDLSVVCTTLVYVCGIHHPHHRPCNRTYHNTQAISSHPQVPVKGQCLDVCTNCSENGLTCETNVTFSMYYITEARGTLVFLISVVCFSPALLCSSTVNCSRPVKVGALSFTSSTFTMMGNGRSVSWLVYLSNTLAWNWRKMDSV